MNKERLNAERNRYEIRNQTPEQIKLKQHELKELKDQRVREIEELKIMKLHDRNAMLPLVLQRDQGKSAIEADNSKMFQIGTDKSLAAQGVLNRRFEGDDYVSDLFNNLLALQNKLRSFTGGNVLHERREDYKSFFMPLNFNGDIRFNLFDSCPSVVWGSHVEDSLNSENPLKCEFQDIDSKVNLKKGKLEEERVHQRWKMHSKEDIENWTTIG